VLASSASLEGWATGASGSSFEARKSAHLRMTACVLLAEISHRTDDEADAGAAAAFEDADLDALHRLLRICAKNGHQLFQKAVPELA